VSEATAARVSAAAASVTRARARRTAKHAAPVARPTLEGFGPVLDARARTLILGSFPSEASLRAGHYYAHPRNQFWPILSEILGEPLAGMPFEQRYQRLLAHRIALWDVIGACDRTGSLDADIRAARSNDFGALLRAAPGLQRVLFNGRTAGRFEPRFRGSGLGTIVLPSTSPAHAGMRYAQKLAAWRAALVPRPASVAQQGSAEPSR